MSQRFRIARATELRQLAQILQREGVVQDITPLAAAEKDCREGSGEYWGYSLDGLIFRSLGDLKTVPQPVKDISLQLTIDVQGICSDDLEDDPFEKYNFQLLVRGFYENKATQDYEDVKCSWHLDRHISNPEENEPNFFHPQYHFQFGGHALKDINEDQKSTSLILLIDSPRIPHPPLDALLGIDFVLTNFLNSAELEFREEGEYANQLEAMQKRLWKPYVTTLLSHWQPNRHSIPWQSNLIWPQLFEYKNRLVNGFPRK